MILANLDAFGALTKGSLGKGPLALIVAEDAVEVNSTVAHILGLGFRKIVLVAPDGLAAAKSIEAEMPERIVLVHAQTRQADATKTAVNHLIDCAPGEWLHYCYNGEYLFFPFSDSRSITEATAFAAEERRYSILTYVIDLYATDLSTHPGAVSLENAHFDRAGYYAETRRSPAGDAMDRQLNFFGGLRWRFEEHVPEDRRKIDRIGLFRAEPGLRLRDGHILSLEELNTLACPWHNSMTAAICSFRVAKALRANPGSRDEIHSFFWHQSQKFEWSSQQLLDLGLMEPGQWF
ncbi:MAG: glycosyltransferase family 2 protein [Pseudomonadota bacterium]